MGRRRGGHVIGVRSSYFGLPKGGKRWSRATVVSRLGWSGSTPEERRDLHHSQVGQDVITAFDLAR